MFELRQIDLQTAKRVLNYHGPVFSRTPRIQLDSPDKFMEAYRRMITR